MFDPDDAPPPLDPATAARLADALAARGPAAAADELVAHARETENFHALFHALLLKKRVELGVSPFPNGPSSDLPPETHDEYETAIREAGRHVGAELLARKRFAQAWSFYKLLGEPEPIRAALEAYAPEPEDDVYPVIEIAWQNGLLPKKGFDLVLDRHGLCSAITMVSGSDLSTNPDLRDYTVTRLAQALHDQLVERLRSDLAGRGTPAPEGATIPEMVEGHPELFADDAYHIDTSHLSSVVQMAMQLPPGAPGIEIARDLCVYGRRLAPGLQGNNDAPFEDNYDDFLAYMNVLIGANAAKHLERFEAKAAREAEVGATYAAQVYINLLVKTNRLSEALAAAKRFLLGEDERNMICPGVSELARRAGDHKAQADAARARGDAVNYLASLIAAKG